MTQYKRVTFSHANLKRPVQIVLGTIAGYHWSDNSQSTHVYTTGGIFPVIETPEQIDGLIDNLTAPKALGEANVPRDTEPRKNSKRQARTKR